MIGLTVTVVSMVFKPAKVLTAILEVVHGRSDQQVNPILGDQLNMETKYCSETNMGQNHTWTHVAVLGEIIVYKPAKVLTVIVEVVHGRSNLQVEPAMGNQLEMETK